MKKWLYTHTIFTQLVVFTLAISLIPTLLITGFLFYRIDDMVRKELSNSCDQLASQYMKNLEDKITQYRNSLDVISGNSTILEALNNRTDNAYSRGVRISEEITKTLLLDRQKEIRNCMLYSSVSDNPVYGVRVSMEKEAEREAWYPMEQVMKGNSFLYVSSVGDTPVLSFIKRVEQVDVQSYTRKKLGFLKLDLYMNQLFEPAGSKGGADSQYDVAVRQEDGHIFYFSNPDITSVAAGLPASFQSLESSGYTVACRNLSGMNLDILLFFDNSHLEARRQEVRSLVLPSVLAVILIVILGGWVYTRSFSGRIECLVKKFKVAETGDLTITDPIGGKDEIADLDRQFSHMLKNLDELIRKNYIWQLKNKEAQLKNLQLQINPHFLYNTLETISSLAAVKQLFGVCDICQKLGEIFRYSLGKDYGDLVTVAQELHYVENYIYIKKQSYRNRFEVFYNISVNTEEVLIIRFILQPIVENAILHGLVKRTAKGTMEISVWEDEDCLMISIEDDGVGMDVCQAERLTREINESDDGTDSDKSIGVRNVNQRIKLACGPQYGIQVRSELHYGSRFDIRLPLLRKGEVGDEKKTSDR